ncbi:hypothetical protein ANCCEY_06581 [Ancylostoma ceylanicum]|uniref:Uncharacterized protein n=1 Tax=Ancylostoma ceylanicum TaxID=53326 RepID=A0A0D6LW70_9BILA|nr:hypothetical protein ANCCEY_06581 [Ancylostoma ceylanicum]
MDFMVYRRFWRSCSFQCDHQCHDEVVRSNSKENDNGMNQVLSVFSSTDLTRYEKELGMLCSFQTCYLQCMIPIVDEVCVPEMAQKTVDLVRSFVHWHATDISDWHAVAGHFEALPESCRQIAGVQPDPVLQLINRE